MGNQIDSLIFRPPLPSYSIKDPHLHLIPTSGDHQIAAYFIKHRNARFTIIFSHGNAEDIGNVFSSLVNRLSNWNCNIFLYDYPGYGLSGGIPSEDSLYNSTDVAYRYLINHLKVDESTIIAYGRSLGCACAMYLGVKYNLLGVILQSPFLSIHRIKLNFSLPFDKFNNLDKAKYLKCPALVIHGEKDEIIPVDHSKQLVLSLPDVYFHFIKNGGHNDLDCDFSDEMDSCLIEFLDFLLMKFSSDSFPEYFSQDMIDQALLNNGPKTLTHLVKGKRDRSSRFKSLDFVNTLDEADFPTLPSYKEEADKKKYFKDPGTEQPDLSETLS